jgi:hypothetical protein
MRDAFHDGIAPVAGPGASGLAGLHDCIGAGRALGACRLDGERA